MKNKGCSTEEIAHSICDYRNQTALISSGKTPEQIISSSMRTNPQWMHV